MILAHLSLCNILTVSPKHFEPLNPEIQFDTSLCGVVRLLCVVVLLILFTAEEQFVQSNMC